MNITNIFKNTSIKVKWIIFVIILVLYPMILIGYIGYLNYEQMITRHFVESVQKDVLTVAEQFKEELEAIQKFANGVQYDEAIYEFTKAYYGLLDHARIEIEEDDATLPIEKRYNKRIIDSYLLKQSVTRYLKSTMLSRQDIEVAAYQFQDGTQPIYIESRDKAKSFINDNLIKDHDIFQHIANAFEGEATNTYYIDENNHLYVGKKIFYRTTGQHCGTAVFKVDKNYLLRKYKGMLEGANEAVYIVANEKNELLAIGNLPEERKGKLNYFVKQYPEPGVIYKEENKRQSVVYHTFQTYNLSIGSAVYISTDLLLADIRATSKVVFLLCLSVLPIFLLLAHKLYKEVVQPVYVLSDKMQRIEKGEMGVEVKSNRRDEFGYVFAAFNRMSRQLEYLVNCVYKEQLALKNAELKNLRAQINPHFLYNTLEMINWKARINGDDDVAEMIEALSGILDVTIDRRAIHLLSLNEEIKYIKNYIFLIEKRFGNKIQVIFDVEPKTLCYNIPKLILQPILENAISHGIEPKGEGFIKITTREKEKSIAIIVSDNGLGIKKDKLEYIQEQLNESDLNHIEIESDDKGHIGVINVQRRIQLLYGKNFGVHIESIEEKGTSVHITLPKI